MTLGMPRYRRPDGWRAFLVARAIRILPLFWIMNVLLLAVLVRLPHWESLANALTLLPLADTGAFSFPPLWVGWTLAFETGFYLMVAIAIGSTHPARMLLMLVAAASLVGIVFRPALPWAQVLFNPILIEFGFGILACLAWQRGISVRIGALAIVLGLILLLVVRALAPELIFSPVASQVVDGSVSLRRALFWGFPWALVLAGVVAADKGEQETGRDVLLTIGNASYAIYLAHAIVIVAIDRSRLTSLAQPAVLATLTIVSSIAAGLAVHWWIEKPLARRLARLAELDQASARSASTVRPRSLTSAKPPSTRTIAGSAPFDA
jgi:peptidoglycan/LPS O-acetylase OafA/YrhL